MTVARVKLQRLRELNDAIYARDQAKLAECLAEAAKLRAKLANLHAAPSAEGPADDLVAHARTLERWRDWADAERAQINHRLALNAVAQAKARGALAVSFGRVQVSNAVKKRMVEDLRIKTARRAP